MKFIITENKLRNFLKEKLNIDLTGKIHKVTNFVQLPDEFGYITPKGFSYYEKFEPMYIIKTPGKTFLYQKQDNDEFIADYRDITYNNFELMQYLGIPNMGISIEKLYDIFS